MKQQNAQQKGFELFTYTELSKLLKISISTLQKYVSAKKIPYHKIGGNVRFTMDDIQEWLEEKKVGKI